MKRVITETNCNLVIGLQINGENKHQDNQSKTENELVVFCRICILTILQPSSFLHLLSSSHVEREQASEQARERARKREREIDREREREREFVRERERERESSS
jgi:hypothetical protein